VTDFPIVCALCFASINDEFLVDHMRWHERLEERQHDLEKGNEAAASRIWLLERQVRGLPVTGNPHGHHHQAE